MTHPLSKKELRLLRVRDSGVGIAPDLMPRIFTLFTQAERSLARSQGGLGIGLALVQRLVEMHEGRVEAFSTDMPAFVSVFRSVVEQVHDHLFKTGRVAVDPPLPAGEPHSVQCLENASFLLTILLHP